MKYYVVFTQVNGGKEIPIARSKDYSKAITFAYESTRDCAVRSVSDIVLMRYNERFYILEIK